MTIGSRLPLRRRISYVTPPCLGRRISAQSRPTPGATTSRPDPPCPRDSVLLSQALVADLRPLVADRLVCDSPRRPVGNLSGHYLPPVGPYPKSNGPPFERIVRVRPGNRFWANGTTASVAPGRQRLKGKFHHLTSQESILCG